VANAASNYAPFTADEKFRRKLELSKPYHETHRDTEFPWFLRQQVENFRARLAGGGVKQCALVVIGDSNSGKSKMLEHHLALIPELQPKLGEDGEYYSPVLKMEAPASCSTKSFAIALLSAIGIPASSRASEFELYAVLKRVLKQNRIECIVVDEMQHAIRGTADGTIKKVQDVFKSLLQIDDWPIHLILLGTSEMRRFLEGDRQLANRCRVMRLIPVSYQDPLATNKVREIVEKIVVEYGGLKIGWTDEDSMIERLMRSGRGALGAIFETTKEACFRAIDEDRDTVTKADFVAVYKVNTGCLPQDNIFESANWKTINPAFAVADLADGDPLPPKRRRAA